MTQTLPDDLISLLSLESLENEEEGDKTTEEKKLNLEEVQSILEKIPKKERISMKEAILVWKLLRDLGNKSERDLILPYIYKFLLHNFAHFEQIIKHFHKKKNKPKMKKIIILFIDIEVCALLLKNDAFFEKDQSFLVDQAKALFQLHQVLSFCIFLEDFYTIIDEIIQIENKSWTLSQENSIPLTKSSITCEYFKTLFHCLLKSTLRNSRKEEMFNYISETLEKMIFIPIAEIHSILKQILPDFLQLTGCCYKLSFMHFLLDSICRMLKYNALPSSSTILPHSSLPSILSLLSTLSALTFKTASFPHHSQTTNTTSQQQQQQQHVQIAIFQFIIQIPQVLPFYYITQQISFSESDFCGTEIEECVLECVDVLEQRIQVQIQMIAQEEDEGEAANYYCAAGLWMKFLANLTGVRKVINIIGNERKVRIVNMVNSIAQKLHAVKSVLIPVETLYNLVTLAKNLKALDFKILFILMRVCTKFMSNNTKYQLFILNVFKYSPWADIPPQFKEEVR